MAFREWMFDHNPEKLEDYTRTADAQVREGEFSGENCYKMFRQMSVGAGRAIPTKLREEVCGVVSEPMYRIDLHNESGGVLHISSGIVDHTLAATRKRLNAIDKSSKLMEDMADIEKEARAILVQNHDQDAQMKKHRLENSRIGTEVTRAKKVLEGLKKKPPGAARNNKIRAESARVAKLVAQQKKHSQQSGLEAANKLKRGATEMIRLVDEFRKEQKKNTSGQKVCGDAAFVFNKLIELIANVRFRGEHGGVSLSNSHSIHVIQHYKAIADGTEKVYKDDLVKSAEVKDVMRAFRRIAEPLQKICALLKTQRKWTDQMIEEFKDSTMDYAIAWREEFLTGKLFPKAHALECCVFAFVSRNRMAASFQLKALSLPTTN